jgi:hypothetical protein
MSQSDSQVGDLVGALNKGQLANESLIKISLLLLLLFVISFQDGHFLFWCRTTCFWRDVRSNMDAKSAKVWHGI